MDTIDNLILHLSSDTRHLYKKLCSCEDYRRDLKEIQEFLTQQLYLNPYPTLHILKYHKSQELHVPSKQIYGTLLKYLENNQARKGSELYTKFLNYLANFHVQDEWMWQVYETLFPKLFRLEDEIKYELYLSLLARPTRKLLNTYLEYGLKQVSFFSKQSVLQQTLCSREHIVARALGHATDLTGLTNTANSKILGIAKLVLQLSTTNPIYNHKFSFDASLLCALELWSETAPLIDILYYDLHRIANIINVLSCSKQDVPLSDIISSQSFLGLVFKHTQPVLIRHDVIMHCLTTNQTLYNKIMKTEIPNLEVDIFAGFYALSLISGTYFLSKKLPSYSKVIDNHLAPVSKTLRSIKDSKIHISVLRNIFLLLFLRWEQVTAVQAVESKIRPQGDHVSGDAVFPDLSGFICSKYLLEQILIIIREQIKERLNDSTLDEISLNSLDSLRQSVADAFWRLSFFEKSPLPIGNVVQQTDGAVVPQLIEFHVEMLEQASSDEDGVKDGTTSLLRRKHKFKRKQRRDTQSDSLGIDSNVKDLFVDGRLKEDWGIVARMLGSPLDLATICLSRDDMDAANSIIQKFHLKDTTLERNITFLNNMRRVKAELQAIIEHYEQQQIASLRTTSTIQNIKKIAAIGFETSKISNIIERFSLTNRIVPDTETAILIEKYCKSFHFLQQYKHDTLQVSIILDLILNLNMNYDISSNILTMTNRLYGSVNLLEQISSEQDLFRGVGSIYFFHNLVDCLYLFKTLSHDNFGVKAMLTETFYPLRPNCLKVELERENIFRELYTKSQVDIKPIENLKTFGRNFAELKPKTNYYNRFLRYVINLSKLLQLNGAECHDNVSEMMNVDVRRLVGEILFEKNISPVHIESIVLSLNLNLVHMIALNIAPRIALAATSPYVCDELDSDEKLKGYEFKNETICSYIASHNSMLDYILRRISGHSTSESFMNSEYFTRALELPEVKVLAGLYDNNMPVATLLFDHLNINQFRCASGKQLIIPIYKIAREKYHKSVALMSLRDDAVIGLTSTDVNNIHLIEFIRDLNVRARILLDDLTKIKDAEIAIKLIKSILLDDKIDELELEKREQLERSLKDIEVYAEVAEDFSYQTWTAAYKFSENASDLIMKQLIKIKKYELCYEWWGPKYKIANIQLKYFHEVFFESLIQTKKRIKPYLLKIIETFPVVEVVCFYEANIEKFKNLPVLNYVVSYLIEHNTKNNGNEDALLKYQNYKVSLHIFNHMTFEECEQNWDLISRPLIIIEQFVMNSKFEVLTKILSSIRPLLDTQACKFCNDRTNAIYEIPTNSSITLGNPKNSAFILLNFNLYQKDHIITAGCIDTILQIYATKALDYRINETSSSNDPISLSTDLASLDSLCGIFTIPKEAPKKENWIKDEDSIQCMCCRRAIFTMLTRRHHCRRCGRVICYSCSTNRLKIPNLYEDIPVRVCNDCYKQTQALDTQLVLKTTSSSETSPESKLKRVKNTDWQLSGNLTHDKLLREEFCYEHAPSAHLCLSILSFHSTNLEYVNLLLHHCRKFEKLLRPLRAGYPNPEIDYGLVAKMLNCLALAAKVRGGPPECDTIRDHSEIIISVVQSGCEALLPMEPINNTSLRKLGDSMVLAEKWPLALDIYLKCGHSTAGVMAAYGLACLRVGRFETAREQLLHCMTRLCKQKESNNIMEIITTDDIDLHHEIDIPIVKRPNRSPPLLDEIIKVIEATSQQTPVPETLARADSIRNSNSSLASAKSRPKEKIPIFEPALNIINTISNLKEISRGNYCDNSIRKLDNGHFVIKHGRMFEECLFYLLAYGTHANIINFLIRQNQTLCALKYFILQNIENDLFIRNIYIKHLKRGSVDYLIRQMTALDDSLAIWKDAIIQTCRYLETKNLLNSLYHLQILLHDPIRASMTCVKFYSTNCLNFRDLQNNSFHLINAQKHLQSELEMCQWENINIMRRRQPKEPSFLMQMDAKSLNGHINTILRQIEVTKFLAKCEQDEKSRRSTRQILKEIGIETTAVPTLFDSIQEKIQIGILVLLCGLNIEEGFGLAYRIIQDYNLPSMRIYGTTAKYLSRNNRLAEVEKLINCITSNNGTDFSEYDKILSVAIQTAKNVHMPEIKSVLDNLIKMIVDIEQKISCHIFVGQLKSAYLLAVQHNRLNDVKNILRHAEASNQIHIKRLCEKKLNINQ